MRMLLLGVVSLLRPVTAGGLIASLNTTMPQLPPQPASPVSRPFTALGGLFLTAKATVDAALGMWGASAALGGSSLLFWTFDDVIINKLRNRTATVNASVAPPSSTPGVVVPSQGGPVGGRGRRLRAVDAPFIASPLALAKLAAFVNAVVITDFAISLKVATEALRRTFAVNRAVATAAPRPAPPPTAILLSQPPPLYAPPMPQSLLLSPSPPPLPQLSMALQGASELEGTKSQASGATQANGCLALMGLAGAAVVLS